MRSAIEERRPWRQSQLQDLRTMLDRPQRPLQDGLRQALPASNLDWRTLPGVYWVQVGGRLYHSHGA